MEVDKTCLSYWYPKIEAAGLPVPETVILKMPIKALRDIYRQFDNKEMTGKAEPFFKKVEKAAREVGFPVFLRSGQTSGKHEWSTTCFVCNIPDIREHITNILYFSACVGVPETMIWAVREMLPIQPIGICLKYNGMPVNREFRYFVNDERILCRHPYWPRKALEDGRCLITDEQYKHLCTPPPSYVDDIARAASVVVGGSWSVDLLETADGWYLTDMAEANKSFHWEGCMRPLR